MPEEIIVAVMNRENEATSARFAVGDYIDVFYNRKRMHSTLDYRAP